MPSVLVNSLNELGRRPITDEKERKEVYDAALRLAWSAESQQDTAQRLYHGHLPLATAQTGIDIGIFDFLSANPESAFTIDELSTQTGTEPALLRRCELSWQSCIVKLTMMVDQVVYLVSTPLRP